MISFPPLLLFLPCRPSPLACISCTGAGIGVAAWVQFLQWLTSAQRLSKSNPLGLTQQPRTCVPLLACVSHSCCCQPQHFALKSYADAGLRWPMDKCSLVHQEVHLWFVFASTPLRWVSPLPFLLFVWLFSHCLLEFRYKNLSV